MTIHTFPLGQMRANCYLIVRENQCLIIDPADSADFILEKVQQLHLELAGIVATHGHFDHIMATGEIQMSYPHIPLHVHEKDQFLLERMSQTAQHFLGYNPMVMPIRLTASLPRGKYEIGTFPFEIIHTPGHTPGSCCLYFENDNVMFTGDTLFQGGIGRYDFSYSDKQDLKNSLERILTMRKDIAIYPGHGEESMIVFEKDVLKVFF